MTNKNLRKAHKNKNDEFYTQMIDVEKELIHYTDHFKDKIVYCNCDKVESNFYKYFKDNFEILGLKKLLRSEVDFRSEESIEKLKEADIIVTNPPFSLFREYVAQLMEYDKKFIIMGSLNAVTYRDTFELMKENKIWLGHTSPKKFLQPDGSIKTFGNISWYTNLETEKRHEDLILYKKYYGNKDKYPKYDNYDAINLNKTKNIPMDYYGDMGVPISFLSKYNPDQFEILGILHNMKGNNGKRAKREINGEKIYCRIIIKRK